MDTGISDQISYLDGVLQREGVERCILAFTEVFRKKGAGAVALLNDRRLSFPCFYVLLPRIRELGIGNLLNSRNAVALRIVNQVINGKRPLAGADYLSVKRNRIYTVLKWMLETGAGMDGYDDDYSNIMDVAVSVLIFTYKDISVIPTAVDMIFSRKKAGRYIHDLVWALFRSEDPQVLRLIAERLKSPEKEETELACELLNIDGMDIASMDAGQREALHASYLGWLEENDPFLYFTEDGYQFESRPVFCAVDMERKYLNKAMAVHRKQRLQPSDEDESRCIQAFKELSDADKELLSRYSRRMHEINESEWKNWLRSPVEEQLKRAKREGELLR